MFFRAKVRLALPWGQYDHDRHGTPMTMEAGTVLLVTDVRHVDDKPHTIVLRAHPSWIPALRSARQNLEIRYLIEDFAVNFEWEPDADGIRETEKNAAQDRIAEIQGKMARLQADPSEIQRLYLKSLQSQDSARQLPVPIMPNRIFTPEAAVQGDIEAFQAQVQAGREMVDFAAKVLTSTAEDLRTAVEAIAPYYEESGAIALARVQTASQHAKKIMEGVQTLDLWLGKEVELQTLRRGASAPDGTPVTFFQRVLFSDEEMCLHRGVDARYDWRSEMMFLQNLDTIPNLLNQILPAQRGVVAIAIRRTDIDYGDGLANYIENQENKTRFLLIRDGENLYRVFSPLFPHRMLPHLFPSKHEIDALFRDSHGEITFRDLAYTDALAAHEKRALVYKRLLILLGGLQEREQIFGNFCSPEAARGFISMAFQKEHFRFVHDADGTGMLPKRRPPFRDWNEFVAWTNEQTQPKHRVVFQARELIFSDSASHLLESVGGRESLRVSLLEETGISEVKEDKEGVQTIGIRTTRGLWSENSVTSRVKVANHFGGWLNLDAADLPTLRYFLQDRDSRRQYKEYVPMFLLAVDILSKERESDAAKWVQEQCAQSGADPDEIIRIWQVAHPGKRLAKKDKALNALIWGPLSSQIAGNAVVAPVLAELHARGEKLLRMGVFGNAQLFVDAAPAQADNRFANDFEILRYEMDGTSLPAEGYRRLLDKAGVHEALVFEDMDACSPYRKVPLRHPGTVEKSFFASMLESMVKMDALEVLLDWVKNPDCEPQRHAAKEWLKNLNVGTRGSVVIPIAVVMNSNRRYQSCLGAEVLILNLSDWDRETPDVSRCGEIRFCPYEDMVGYTSFRPGMFFTRNYGNRYSSNFRHDRLVKLPELLEFLSSIENGAVTVRRANLEEQQVKIWTRPLEAEQ